jgi:glycogen synthase
MFTVKIMIITGIFPPGFIGGFELAALDIARGLKEKGYDVCVVTSDHFLDYDLQIQDFPVFRVLEYLMPNSFKKPYSRDALKDGFFINFRNIRLLSYLLHRFKPDSIVFFDGRGIGTLGILKYVIHSGYKPVLNLGDNIFNQLNENKSYLNAFCSIFGSLNFLLNVKGILVSHSLGEAITNTLGFQLADQTVISRWTREPRQKASGFYDRLDNVTRFVFASSLIVHKGIYKVIDAVKEILSSGNKNFIVDIYGNGQVSEVIHHIAVNGLEEHVQYRGAFTKDQVVDILAGYDALLFPTWKKDPFGTVAAEAAAAGCVPITTAGTGAADWLLDGIDCFKIEPNSSDVAAAMIKFMRLPWEGKAAMSKRAVISAKKFYNFPTLLDATEKIIVSAASAQEKKNLFCPIKSHTALYVLQDLWEKKLSEKK